LTESGIVLPLLNYLMNEATVRSLTWQHNVCLSDKAAASVLGSQSKLCFSHSRPVFLPAPLEMMASIPFQQPEKRTYP